MLKNFIAFNVDIKKKENKLLVYRPYRFTFKLCTFNGK